MLTERQQEFCRVYRESGDVTAAAVAAGYSAKSARSIGLKLLKQPEIQRALAAAAISVSAPAERPSAPPAERAPQRAAASRATPVASEPAAPVRQPRPARPAVEAQPAPLSAAATNPRPRSAPPTTRRSEPAPAPTPMPIIAAPRRPVASRPPQSGPAPMPADASAQRSDLLGKGTSAVRRTGEVLGPLGVQVARGVSAAGVRVAQGGRDLGRAILGRRGNANRDGRGADVTILRKEDGVRISTAHVEPQTGWRGALNRVSKSMLGRYSESADYTPLLKLLLVNCLAAFGIFVLWHFGLIQAMLATDHTRISIIIMGIFVVTALHCFYQTAVISRELIVARRVRDAVLTSERGLAIVDDKLITPSGEVLEDSIMTTHIFNLYAKSRARGGGRIDQTLLLRSLADQLRGREKLGLFIAEALLRLALLGTAVGFILMLIPIAGLNSFDTESLRGTLTGMSGGMAIALNVTVTGIAAALLLKFQYYLLDEAIADLFRQITETTEVHVVSSLDRAPYARAAAAE